MPRGAKRAAKRSSRLREDAETRKALNLAPSALKANNDAEEDVALKANDVAEEDAETKKALGFAPSALKANDVAEEDAETRKALNLVPSSFQMHDVAEAPTEPGSAITSDGMLDSSDAPGSLDGGSDDDREEEAARHTPRFVELAQEKASRNSASLPSIEAPRIQRKNSTTGAGLELAARLEQRLSKAGMGEGGRDDDAGSQLTPRTNSARKSEQVPRLSRIDSELCRKLEKQQERLRHAA